LLAGLRGKNRDIDDVDEYCMTALHWAALSGDITNVITIVEAGADLDCLNNGLNSPLLLAA
jgi:ankyrin repeat protein